MLKKLWFTALAPLMALALASAGSELLVSVEVVHEPGGYALKIGEATVPVRAYEMPLCLATAKGEVKLALKLEGEPPKVTEIKVVEGPCPKGTELRAPVAERLETLVRHGYLEGKGMLVREQNRWMLRVNGIEVPIDPESLPPCLREAGAMVEVRTLSGDEGELTLAKGDCQARIEVRAEVREQLRMALKAEKPEIEGFDHSAKRAMERVKAGEEQRMEQMGEVKNEVKEIKEGMKENTNEVKEKVEGTFKTPGDDY